jgi:hypothetical protein
MQATLVQHSPRLMEEKILKNQVSERYKRFKKCRENVENDERNGRPRCHRTDENILKKCGIWFIQIDV